MTILRATTSERGILSEEECRRIAMRLLEDVGTPRAGVNLESSVRTSARFSRARAHLATSVEGAAVSLFIDEDDRRGVAVTNRLDDAGLRALVDAVWSAQRSHRTSSPVEFLPPADYPAGPQLYYDSIYRSMGASEMGSTIGDVMSGVQGRSLIGAGDLSLVSTSRATVNTRGLWAYERATFGDVSVTVRTPNGGGSGWAWGGNVDWRKVDAESVRDRAIALAARSANPVAVEPGRYTVILEPAAVAALIGPILRYWNAQAADGGSTVFSGSAPGTNRIGERMIDERLNMVSDSWDPIMPGSTIARNWAPIDAPVHWFENGVLKNLAYDAAYTRFTGGDVVTDPGGVRLSGVGTPQSLEEMISSTSRGIWVNRLSNIVELNARTLLLTGSTRDGTFLIENGEVTRPVKNFRFMDSPMFVLNRLQAFGDPVMATNRIVAPRLKAGDFNFTSISDAI